MAELLGRDFSYDTAAFERARRLFDALAGLPIGDGKRDLVYNRISRRMRSLRLQTFDDYFDLVERDESEQRSFVNALTTNLTAFFREPHHFQTLSELAMSWTAKRPMRIWSAASSTGEEAYSAAMTLLEVRRRHKFDFSILASDIDSEVLARASAGIYELDRIQKVPPDLRIRYVERGHGAKEGLARVRREVRECVTFAQLNLLSPAWAVSGTFDVIFCRNVLIYFRREDQRSVVAHFHKVLEEKGILFTGHAESLFYAANLFSPVGRTTYARIA